MKISETDNQVGDDGRDVEIERLKRKCDELRARERRANAEAKEARQNLARLLSASKAFASSMRDRTAERGRFQRRLAAQYAVSRVLAQTDDLKEAAPGILNTFGDGFGWDLGALWTLDKEAGVLRCDEVRRSPGSTLSRGFEAACRRASFPRGAGLPGRVWASGKALCVEDFLAGDDVRAEAADGEGPRRAFAFPIQDRNFLAVLEFFGSDAWPPDEELLQTATLIHDQIGQFIRRRRAEEALRENEKRFRAFFDTAAVGMAQTSFASGRFLRVNDKLCRLLGYDEDELLSMTLLQVTHPDDRARDAEGLSQLLRGEIREYVTEKKYLRKDGRIVWADLAVALLRDEDGHPLHTVTVIQDATERKLAEEALRESEERYKALYENNPSMYFTLDLDGTVLSVNRFGAEHLGYTVEELLGRPVINVFHEEDREGVSRHFRECLQDPGRTSGWEARKVCKDGSVLWVRENVRVARDPYGDMIVLVACEDITEHKQAEEERERSLARELEIRARAEERRRISRELHDRVAHTMGVVHQSLELYEALKGSDPAMAESKMELARKMAKEALTSTRNLSMELRREEVRRGLEAALVDLSRNIVPPTIRCELVVEGDETLIPPRTRNHLFLILREALRNALAHSGCERVKIEIDITPQRVVGIVEDDGRGFTAEEVRSGGGFKSMEERASLVGGTFGVSSEPNGGTKVKVSVPLENA